MYIKEWKQFSDLVDKENDKRVEECVKSNREWREEEEKERIKYNEKHKNDKLFSLQLPCFTNFFFPMLIDKTMINFYEWKAGKLKFK